MGPARMDSLFRTDHPERRSRAKSEIRVYGIVWSAVIAAVSILAFLGANYGCGHTDGSFSFAEEYQSSYCQTTHLPGFPDSAGALALLAAIFLAPTLVALSATWLAHRRGSFVLLRIGLVIAGALAIASVALTSQASVTYPGAG